MPTDRGEYRPMFTRILNGPSFQALGSDARHVLHAVKLLLPAAGLAVLPGMEGQFIDATALPGPSVRAALEELKAAGWVDWERNVIWLIRGLEFEPTLNPQNDKHRAHIQRTVKALPSLGIVDRYRAHYTQWFEPIVKPPEGPSESPSKGLPRGPRSTTPTPSPSPERAGSSSKNPASRVINTTERRTSPRETKLEMIAGAIRKHWWAPDGKPPEGWTMARELSIWKAEFNDGVAPENGLKAIEGLRALAESGTIDWLRLEDKLTARALFHAHTGAVRMYPSALDAYYRIGDKPPPKQRARGLTSIGEVKVSIGRVG